MHYRHSLVGLRHLNMYVQSTKRVPPRDNSQIFRHLAVTSFRSHLLVWHGKRVSTRRNYTDVMLASELC